MSVAAGVIRPLITAKRQKQVIFRDEIRVKPRGDIEV